MTKAHQFVAMQSNANSRELGGGGPISVSLTLTLNFSGPPFCCAGSWKYGFLL